MIEIIKADEHLINELVSFSALFFDEKWISQNIFSYTYNCD